MRVDDDARHAARHGRRQAKALRPTTASAKAFGRGFRRRGMMPSGLKYAAEMMAAFCRLSK